MVFIQPSSIVLTQQSLLAASAGPFSVHPLSLSASVAAKSAALAVRGGAAIPPAVDTFRYSLLVSTFLCTSVFGMMLFAAAALMPGITVLTDAEYLESFKAVDQRFQDFQPCLMFFWIGAALSNLITTGIGVFGKDVLPEKNKWWMIVSTVLYLAGQVSTIVINLPLNGQVQALDTAKMNTKSLAEERGKFEGPWVAANWFRTVVFGLSSAIMLVQVLFLK